MIRGGLLFTFAFSSSLGQACDAQKSLEQRCDVFADCVDGTCQFEDPAQCK